MSKKPVEDAIDTKSETDIGMALSGANAQSGQTFDADALASDVVAAEAKAQRDFMTGVWEIADMLAAGLKASGMSVTHYKTLMAAALRRSRSFADKYLRMSRVSAEERALAQATCTSFNSTWARLFPKPPAPVDDDSDGEPADDDVADDDPDEEPADDDVADDDSDFDEPHRETDHAPTDVTDSEHPAEATVTSLLTALEVDTAAAALTRITEFRHSEAEVNRLQRQMAKLEKQNDELLRELGVETIKQAIGAIRELKARAAA